MIKERIINLFLRLRRYKYSLFSNNKRVKGSFRALQPVVVRGKGSVSFGENNKFGVINSPNFYNGYCFIEARNSDAEIIFKNNVNSNNCLSITAEHFIEIGNDVLIGNCCKISDSNFHNLALEKRLETDPNPEPVIIKDNVFIGDNVTILKGVVLGENLVVGSGSLVTKSFKDNVVIAGVPAKIIREL